METLELLKLLNSNLNTITVKLTSDKDWVDYISVISPMIIGIGALFLTVMSNNKTLKSQNDNSITIAKVEIATRLRFDWLNKVRELNSKLSFEINLLIRLNIKRKVGNEKISGYSDDSNIEKIFLMKQDVSLYEEIVERQRNVSTLILSLLTYLDKERHAKIFNCANEIESILNSSSPLDKFEEFNHHLGEFTKEMYLVIDGEWKAIQTYPLGY